MVDTAKRFEQTLHVIFQESLDGTVEVEDVFLVGETMAFVVFHHVFHFHSASSEGRHHLVAFVLVDARIVGPLCDEERGRDRGGRFVRTSCRASRASKAEWFAGK